jgi:hypothetical protein
MRSQLFESRYLTLYVPPSGFLNLLTVYSSSFRVTLFHVTGTCRILPSELFPFAELFDALASTMPSCRYLISTNIPGDIDVHKIRLQGFAPCESPLPLHRCYTLYKPDALLGFIPSRAYHHPAVVVTSNNLPSCTFSLDATSSIFGPALQGFILLDD